MPGFRSICEPRLCRPDCARRPRPRLVCVRLPAANAMAMWHVVTLRGTVPEGNPYCGPVCAPSWSPVWSMSPALARHQPESASEGPSRRLGPPPDPSRDTPARYLIYLVPRLLPGEREALQASPAVHSDRSSAFVTLADSKATHPSPSGMLPHTRRANQREPEALRVTARPRNLRPGG